MSTPIDDIQALHDQMRAHRENVMQKLSKATPALQATLLRGVVLAERLLEMTVAYATEAESLRLMLPRVRAGGRRQRALTRRTGRDGSRDIAPFQKRWPFPTANHRKANDT